MTISVMHQFKLIGLFVILCELYLGVSASTHWVVTENGKIQSQFVSMFDLKRPYDLWSLLEQEKRVDAIEVLQNELLARKNSIDQRWGSLEGAADLELRLTSQDPDCQKAGRTQPDAELYISLFGDIREHIKLENFLTSVESGKPEFPDCSAVIDLDFSMLCFEHLQVMVKRANLSTSPELSLAPLVLEDQAMTQFAHQIALGLQRNATSWLHYNLAAIYWRIQGNAPNAVECARRAVHFAPRQYKDIALLTLGGLLQQAKASVEAALVLHAAVDHAPHVPQNHLALGLVYAFLGDYNRSIACSDNALKLLPSLKTAFKLRHIVKCHQKLEHGLLQLHQSLQDMLGDLREYHGQQEQWLLLEERLIRERAPLKLLNEDSVVLSLPQGASCIQQHPDGTHYATTCEDMPWQSHQQVQLLLQKVESEAKKISEQMLRHNPLSQGYSMLNTYNERKPVWSVMSEYQEGKEGAGEEFMAVKPWSWPSEEECNAYVDKFPVVQEMSTVFLVTEEQGFE